MPPVVLIEGGIGIGKRKLAAYVAGLLVCTAEGACGKCFSCEALLHGRNDDVFWLETDDATYKLDEAHNLSAHLEYLPFSSGGKKTCRVAVVVDADKLSVQAVNALLKTLEETPSRVFVIMTTSRPQALLPTLLSRAIRWRVRNNAVRADGGQTPADLEKMLQELWASNDKIRILKIAETISKELQLAPSDAIRQLEMSLNKLYKSCDAKGGYGIIPVRRNKLREIKYLVLKKRTHLNTQALVEQVAFAVV